MSRNDKGDRTNAVDWAFPLIGLLIAISLAWGAGFLAGHQSEQRNSASRTYQEKAKERAQRECVGIEPASVFDCVAQKYETADDTQRSEQDLTAQQQAAWAGMISSAWSALALLASFWGLLWIKGTLDATREGANAARGAVNETRRIGEAQTRAYLSVKSVSIQRARSNLWVKVAFNNCGQSPALRVAIGYSISVEGSAATDLPEPTWQKGTQNFPAASDSDATRHVAVGIFPNEHPQCKWIMMKIFWRYRDVFDNIHEDWIGYVLADDSCADGSTHLMKPALDMIVATQAELETRKANPRREI